ncbi:MAG TPA: alpha/beta hydrolase family protein [Acidimicrobiales bacterium]|nr:alpha/beta hydrolase family protein [Acidimicrobiales bacterium]
MRRALGIAVAVACTLTFPVARAATNPTAAPLCLPRLTAPPAGLDVTSSAPVKNHPRVTDVTFRSRALNGPVHADVLLPAGYDAPANATRRYPVLYLLHGHGGNHTDWVSHDADKVVGDLPVIVVMPDGGYDGWYSDWYGTDVDGHVAAPAPGWETFHVRELMPWVDATYRTIADRRGRAVAGLSMGGFGAMSYAARHPDLFVAAGSFSGAVDIDFTYPLAGTVLATAANLPDGKQPDNCVWGDALTNDVVWRDHNPTELAGNLSALSLYLASGNGRLGRYDTGSPGPGQLGAQGIEAGVFVMTDSFDKALTAARVVHTTNLYGPGTHSWPYWVDDLRAFLPRMQAAFARPPAAPPGVPFSFESAASPFSIWGWTFTPHRDVAEMTYLRGVSGRGFDVSGSGLLSVVTAPLYRSGAMYRVTGARARTLEVQAGGDGRLRFDVDLGTSHSTQQYAFGPTSQQTFPHARVAIAPS